MTRRAHRAFVLEAWDAALGRVSAPKRIQGDREGTSHASLLTVPDAGGQRAVYVGVERATGSLHGRGETFVLHHTAPGTAGESIVIRIIGSSEMSGEQRCLSAGYEGRHLLPEAAALSGDERDMPTGDLYQGGSGDRRVHPTRQCE